MVYLKGLVSLIHDPSVKRDQFLPRIGGTISRLVTLFEIGQYCSKMGNSSTPTLCNAATKVKVLR